MAILDIVVIAVIGAAAVIGFFKGVLKSVLRFLEIIVTLGLSALAAMVTVWLGLVDLENAMTDFMGSGALYAVIAFVAMFVISVIVCDYIVNKLVYRKRSFKKALANRIWGMVLNTLLWTVIVFLVCAVLCALEGTEYDYYVAITNGSVLAPMLFDSNPLAPMINNLMVESGGTKILVGILNAIWPNFEYLA